MIAFKGLNEAFESKVMTEWCRKNNYTLRIFGYKEVNQAIKYVNKTPRESHIEVWGYSRGAVAGYDLIRLTPTIRYSRLHTIGTYHTVTSSFGKSRPVPQNVSKHTNYVETHQQPKGFFKNPNNVSLGPVNHFEATKKALEEHGASLEASEKEAIEAALKELDEAIKGSDKAVIEAKTEALGKASQKLGEKVMAAEQAKAGGAAAGAAPGGEAKAAPDADVVDADFKEVDDKK